VSGAGVIGMGVGDHGLPHELRADFQFGQLPAGEVSPRLEVGMFQENWLADSKRGRDSRMVDGTPPRAR